MSGALLRARGLFVHTDATPAQRSAAAAPQIVVVLCTSARAQTAASALALALSRASGARCAVAAAVGAGPLAPASLTSAARQAAARLRELGDPASAVGRLVWLADRRESVLDDGWAEGGGHEPNAFVAGRHAGAEVRAHDPPAAAAGRHASAVGEAHQRSAYRADGAPAASAAVELSAAVARASAASAVPAALAIPCARSEEIDRLLASCDGIVVVREPSSSPAIHDVVLGSLAELGRPVVAMEATTRLASSAARAGLHAPAGAVEAVAHLRSVWGAP